MGTFDLGAPVISTWTGAPAGGTYAVSLTRPDGTSFTAPAISSPPAAVNFVPDMPGRWFVKWTSTGPSGAYTDVVDVWPADPRFLISTDDAISALNWVDPDPKNIEDLRLYIAAATPVIEDIVGTIVQKTRTQKVQRGWSYAALYDRPATITGITYDSDGSILDPNMYIFDQLAGLITFWTPTQDIATITYTVGGSSVPQNVRLATRELIRHWWQIGRNTVRPNQTNLPLTGEAWTPSGFAVPRRVIELCQSNARAGGFA